MQIWADVFNARGVKLGDGPIVNIRSASVTRILDSAGDFNIEIAGADARALDLIKAERRITVWVRQFNQPRELFSGIIRNPTFNDAEGGKTLSVAGLDILHELARRNVFYALEYNGANTLDILEDMISLAPGWALATTETGTTTMETDTGVSVLAGIKTVAQNTGRHFRLDEGRTVRFGTLGDVSGLRIYQTSGGGHGFDNPHVAFITRLEHRINGDNMANVINPLGAASSAAIGFVDLGYATPTPKPIYPIKSLFFMDDITKPVNYIEDTESVAEYGEIQATVSFSTIKALGATQQDIYNAGDALHTAAVAWLQKNRVPQNFYTCTVKNIGQTIRPGQKVYLQYKGDAWLDGHKTRPVDIAQDLWVIRVNERFDQGGLSVDLELSEIDQVENTDDEKIADVIEHANRLE